MAPAHWAAVKPDPRQSSDSVERVGTLLNRGTIDIPIQRTHRLDDAVGALAGLGAIHKQGKHALVVHRQWHATMKTTLC